MQSVSTSQHPPASRPRFPYRWRTRQQLADRFGAPCRIVPTAAVMRNAAGDAIAWGYGAHGSTNRMIVEFEDGTQVETTRGSIRLRRGHR